MNKSTTYTIIALVVIAVIFFVLWRFVAPAEVMAPAAEENNDQETSVTENSPSGQFIQQAPENDPEETQEEETEETTEPDSEVTISITDTGFKPETVTVPLGTKVTFVNNGQALHWPASDNHPTHDILPEFDSKKGISTGDTYSYTFNKGGTWEYHDHLNAQFGGTIVVE